jgi:hypothetical protein|tara:strand:- start:718 stop:960 length:243 start_codon:yes stop_codon:yes gene_type:complete
MSKKKLNQVQMYAEQTTGVRLSSHEKLCAYRMKEIQDSIKELNKEVKALRTDVSMGRGMIRIIVFAGTIIATVIGVINFK